MMGTERPCLLWATTNTLRPLALLGGVCALYAALFLRRISTPTPRAGSCRVYGTE